MAASQSAPGVAAAMPEAELKPAETYRRLLRYVRPYWWIVAAVVVPAAIYAVVGTAVPLLMGNFIDQLGDAARNSERAWVYPALIVLGFPIRGAMDVLTVYGLAWVGRSVIRDLRTEVFAHYLGLPARYFDQGSSGVLISRLTYNTEMVAEAISNAVVIMLRDSLAVLTLLGVMIWYSPRLTLTVAVIGPVVVFVVALMSRAFRRYSARIQASMGDVTRLTEQSLHGHRVVKVFEGQDHERQQFQDVNARNFRFNVRIVAVHAVGDALTQYAIALGLAAVMYLSFGDLTAASFLGFITAMGMLLTPLKRLVNINSIVQRAITAAAGVFEILDQPEEADTGTAPLTRARGDVAYRNVSFRYESGKERALRDVSLDVAAGTTVALVGQSGSGKTTLVSLLPRFYDPDHGAVLLDGRDVREYSLRDLRRQIALVGQDVVLFDDTIANNISYGALAKFSRADVERAAEAAYVTEFAAALPRGLDTRVGERGALLSGGQRQRIAIARALLKDAPVLVLDEATSALDTESERRVQAALASLMRGRTTLVVAHRLSTVERADRIVAMREGTIVESGTHAELLARGGYYASLYKMQFTV
ncbi:MAG TPA: lipid A export permease/ATP-binding protein MsbA [Gammaproteobacteria bacterium]|nr:lipid A export permease/ATP-binding protein MsbA [Gammaproteobacteria bacterium]